MSVRVQPVYVQSDEYFIYIGFVCAYTDTPNHVIALKKNDWNDCNDCLICSGPPMTAEKNKNRQLSEWVLPVFALFISFFSAFIWDRVNLFDDRRVIESTINKKCHTNWDKGSNYDHANIINSLVNTNFAPLCLDGRRCLFTRLM